MRWTGDIRRIGNLNPQGFCPSERLRRFASHKNRSTTSAVCSYNQTIKNGEARDLQIGRSGIADQDGGSFTHCAGLRLPPPKTPRSPK